MVLPDARVDWPACRLSPRSAAPQPARPWPPFVPRMRALNPRTALLEGPGGCCLCTRKVELQELRGQTPYFAGTHSAMRTVGPDLRSSRGHSRTISRRDAQPLIALRLRVPTLPHARACVRAWYGAWSAHDHRLFDSGSTMRLDVRLCNGRCASCSMRALVSHLPLVRDAWQAGWRLPRCLHGCRCLRS